MDIEKQILNQSDQVSVAKKPSFPLMNQEMLSQSEIESLRQEAKADDLQMQEILAKQHKV